MLKECITITECEEVLSTYLPNVDFLGQVELSVEDVTKLGLLIGQQMNGRISEVLQYLKDKCPVCMAMYLVGIGIWFYKEGDFWSYVSDGIQCELDSNQQAKWGRSFLSFLRIKDLYKGVIPGGHRYVSSIILEGGIPQDSLPAFINRVVRPLVNHDFFDENDIFEEIDVFRKNETDRIDLQRRINRASLRLTIIKNDQKTIQTLLELKDTIKELSAKIDKNIDVEDYPTDWYAYENNILDQVEQYDQTLQQLYRRKEQLDSEYRKAVEEERRYQNLVQSLENVKEFEVQVSQEEKLWDQLLNTKVNLKAQIEKLIFELGLDAITEHSIYSLLNLDLDILEYIIKERNTLIACYHSLLFRILLISSRLFYSQKMSLDKEQYTIYRELLEDQLAASQFNTPLNQPTEIDACMGSGVSSPGEGLMDLSSDLEQLISRKNYLQSRLNVTLRGVKLGNFDVFSIPDTLPLQLRQLRDAVMDHLIVSQKNNTIESKLQNIREQIELAWKEVAPALDMEMTSVNADELINTAKIKLIETQKKCRDAGNELSCFINGSDPVIEEATKKKDSLSKKLQDLAVRIARLGNGDIEKGLKILDEQRIVQSQLHEIENNIQCMPKTLPSIGDLPTSMEDILSTLQEQENLERQLKFQVQEMKGSLDNIVEMFPWLPEPVYRFLLYGGKWAEEWVHDAICHYRNNGDPEAIHIKGRLPSRVIEWFRNQLQNDFAFLAEELETKEFSGNRYSTPVMVLDTSFFELKLLIGPQRISIDPASPPKNMIIQVVEYYNDKTQKTSEIAAPLYYCSRDQTQVETALTEFSIRSLAWSYIVRIVINDAVLYSWVVDGLKSDSPCLIFRENGKKLAGKNIPRQRLWFLLPGRSQCTPEIRDIKKVPVDYLRPGFELRLYDLSAQDYFIVKNPEDNQVIFEVEYLEKPYFDGGTLIDCISCQDINAYSEMPEYLILPWPKEELSGWRLSISHGFSKTKNIWNLSGLEILDRIIESNEASCKISMSSLLNHQATGWYVFKIQGSGWERYTLHLLILPAVAVDFNYPYYWLNEDDINEQVIIIVPWGTTFVCQSPAHIESVEDDVYQVRFNLGEDSVYGQILVPLSDWDADEIPIQIQIPKLQYRFMGKDGLIIPEWVNGVDEIWIGYWKQTTKLDLEIELSSWAGTLARLFIDGKRMGIERAFREGKCTFDLLEIYDTINDDASSHIIHLEIYDRQRRPVRRNRLFQIRCRWEAFDIKIRERHEDDNRILSLEWKEKGKSEYRVVRLWNRDTPWLAPYSIPVSNDENRLMINISRLQLPPGEYSFEITEEDPWAAGIESIEFPQNTNNCLIYTIDNGEIFIDDLKVEWINKNKLVISGYIQNTGRDALLEVLVIGMNMGQGLIYRRQGKTLEDGFFEIILQTGKNISPFKGQQKLTLKDIAHWIGVRCSMSVEFLTFYCLPFPASLDSLIEKGMELALDKCESLIFKSSGDDDQIIFRELNQSIRTKFIKAWQSEQESFEAVDGKLTLRTTAKKTEIYLEIERGIICTDSRCPEKGRILPNIDVWYQEHKRCKTLKTVKDAISGQLYFRYDISKALNKLKSIYGINATNLLKIFEYRGLPGQPPSWMASDQELIELLRNKENEILKGIGGAFL